MNPFHYLRPRLRMTSLAFLSLVLIGTVLFLNSRKGNTLPHIFDHLRLPGAAPLAFSIHTDFEQLLSNRSTDDYQKATFTWTNAEGKQQDFKGQVRVRGVSRREYCDFPPLKVKFKKKQLKERQICTDDKQLKIVTHCNQDDQFVLREYLVYKLYQVINEEALRVQLARINYYDEGQAVFADARYGFFIEHHEQLAKRHDCFLNANTEKKLEGLSTEEYLRLVVFQYMIGNTDWNLHKRHNIKMLRSKSLSANIPIPYDFDMAGLVNAPYAKPYKSLPIESVTERFFQNRSKNQAQLEQTLNYFASKRAELREVCTSFPHLDPVVKEEVVLYLDSFFALLDDPGQRQKHFFAESGKKQTSS